MRTLAIGFCLLVVLTSPAQAGLTGGWFADPEGTQNWLGVYKFVPFSLYFVVWGGDASIESLEFGLQGMDSDFILAGSELLVEGSLEATEGPAFRHFVAVLNPCADATAPIPLLRIDFFTLDDPPVDLRLYATGAESGELPAARVCGGDTDTIDGVPVVIPVPPDDQCFYLGAPEYVFLLNPTPICYLPIEPSSFGSLKARY